MDPLDAFMEAEVNPEIKAKEEEERRRREENHRHIAEQLAVRTNLCLSIVLVSWSAGCLLLQAGKIPRLDAILNDSDSEEEPDHVLQIPARKVKLMVGAGGEKIKWIQKKTKCRVQVSRRPATLRM